ncbi:hypothetical protein Pta02_43050 [Planobispora takensis]|uniref:Uncharacterized protein n=1 Tax=Planobispora takensis TaxID=1367882 RepID=A0A8J3SXJ8_9ACTN|nr:hypothetical protein Pta02_43050 [Planobispora takensis]
MPEPKTTVFDPASMPFLDDPVLYVWSADEGNGHAACGVAHASASARRALLDALTTMPTSGTGCIRTARLDVSASPYPSYVYGRVLLRAWRDNGTGSIVLHSP